MTRTAGTYDPLDLLSVAQLAELWKVHPKTIRKWIDSGDLASVQLGSRRRVPRAAAEDFVHRCNGTGP